MERTMLKVKKHLENKKTPNQRSESVGTVDSATLQKEVMSLRMLLWLHHGHDGLYGDDGEMQCAKCGIDFKRDPVASIKERIRSIIIK
jgi:hypothetical protein